MLNSPFVFNKINALLATSERRFWSRFTGMIDILKPLFIYRKYLDAQKILKKASLESATNTINGKPVFVKLYAYQMVYQNMPYHKIIPERYLEALMILEKNKHINIWKNIDILNTQYQCTDLGEIAINDGFYIHEAYKKVAVTVGACITILTPIVIAIAKYLPLLIGMLYK
jgi:hypothetical protein